MSLQVWYALEFKRLPMVCGVSLRTSYVWIDWWTKYKGQKWKVFLMKWVHIWGRSRSVLDNDITKLGCVVDCLHPCEKIWSVQL